MKLIGIPASESKTQYYLNQAYADYVGEAGMIPILLTPQGDPAYFAEMCDGLLLPGGVDIEPTYYGEPNIASCHVDPDKDEFERSLLHAFVNVSKPVFGICRGMQLIVREYMLKNDKARKWATYYQHIGDHSLVDKLDIPRTVPSHMVDIKMALYGGDEKEEDFIFTNSMHHQALVMNNINKPPKTSRLEVLATSVDGLGKKEAEAGKRIIEAIRIKHGKANIIAVQWHPEELRDYELIQKFFDVEEEKEIEEDAAAE